MCQENAIFTRHDHWWSMVRMEWRYGVTVACKKCLALNAFGEGKTPEVVKTMLELSNYDMRLRH